MPCRSSSTPHEGGGIDMKHPTNRAARRHERDRIIARRTFVDSHIFFRSGIQRMAMNPVSGKYAKWNLGCGCIGCHFEKIFAKHKRRARLKRADFEEVGL
jgi:hypothetical protein